MANHKGEYKKRLARYERAAAKLRHDIENDVKQFIKHRALSTGVDLTNTQHSLSADNLTYPQQLQRVKFNQFQDFINELADIHKVDFYFTVENGRFRWL
jgi:hypothetical protein